MAEQRFHTEITADAAQFSAEMEVAAQKILNDSQRMQSAWRESMYGIGKSSNEATKTIASGFGSMISNMRGILATAAATITGGLFAKFGADAKNNAIEAERLGHVLGVTTQEASALKNALQDIGTDTETYTAIVSKMTMKLREGEERFNELGIKTRDSNNALLPTQEIVRNAVNALMEFKAGTDRNLASTDLFGKGWNDVVKLLRLTPEVLEEARKKTEALGIAVGPEEVAKAHAYQKAMADIKDVFEAIGKAIAENMLPNLIKTADFFNKNGPSSVGVFLKLLNGLKNVAVGIYITFEQIRTVIGGAVAIALIGLEALTNKNLSFANALKLLKEVSAETAAQLAAIGKSNPPENGKGPGTSPTVTGGTKTYTPKKEASASRASQFEAELAVQRDEFNKQQQLQGTFHQFTLRMESDFWKSKIALTAEGSADRYAVEKKYRAVEQNILKEAFELEIADIKARIEGHKQGSVERIQLAGEAAAKIGQKFGLESKEYRQAVAEMSKTARERHAQQNKLDELALESERSYQVSRVELERQNLDTLESLGIITAKQKLARLKELAEIEFQSNLQAAGKSAELIENDVVAHQQALDKIAEMKRRHALNINKIDEQLAQDQKKTIDTWIDPLTEAMNGMVAGVLQGTQTLRQMTLKLLDGIALSYANMLLKMGADWAKAEIFKTQATAAGTAARTAAEAAGASASTGFTFGAAIQNIGAKAWEAAASVYSSVAQIPVVGPFLAPGMAIAASAAVLGFIGNIASAAKGFDVPSGINPMTQLHEREMVLPATLADRVRGMTAPDVERAYGSGDTFNIHVIDRTGFEKLLSRSGDKIARVLRAEARNFNRNFNTGK